MDFILGYMLPILPVALAQTLVCYLVAIPLGLDFGINVILALLGMIPMAPSGKGMVRKHYLQYYLDTAGHGHLRAS